MPSPDQITLNFKKDSGVYYYSKVQLKMFNTITNALATGDSIDVPDFISKHHFDLFLSMFNDHPAIDMMKSDAFSHVLRIAEYLDITNPYIRGFFSRLCTHSILGTHKHNILSSQIHDIVPKGKPHIHTTCSGSCQRAWSSNFSAR